MSIQDLGNIDILGADAVGQPGQRRFRLFARSGQQSAVFWLEKEQLIDLSLHIDQMLAQVSDGRILRVEARAGGLPATGAELPRDFPLNPDYDFRVGEIHLTFEGRREAFMLGAVPLEIEEDERGEPQIVLQRDKRISLWFSLEQAQQLTRQITALTRSGRPVCPLCQEPLEEGRPHICERQNGHHAIVLGDE